MATTYEIRVKGHLPPHWSDWLEGLSTPTTPTAKRCCAARCATRRRCLGW
jgi:hypothetical protein